MTLIGRKSLVLLSPLTIILPKLVSVRTVAAGLKVAVVLRSHLTVTTQT